VHETTVITDKHIHSAQNLDHVHQSRGSSQIDGSGFISLTISPDGGTRFLDGLHVILSTCITKKQQADACIEAVLCKLCRQSCGPNLGGAISRSHSKSPGFPVGARGKIPFMATWQCRQWSRPTLGW
jgi:hypothetical protein